MSLREKSAWVCLITILIVFVPYFVFLLPKLWQGEGGAGLVLGAFIGATIFCAVLSTILAIAVAVSTKDEPKDERDVLIEGKANRNAYYVLLTLCFLALSSILLVGLGSPETMLPTYARPAFVSQIFLLCFVIAEVTKYATQVVCYRRGS